MEDNKNTNNETQKGLLTKLRESLENSLTRLRSTKIYKALPALAMSVIMAFTPITLSACNSTNPTLPNTPGTEQGPGSNPGTDPSNPGTEDPYEGYSDLLKSVLNNTKYKNLITAARNYELNYLSAYLDPHPYGFLEEEGFDVSKIKEGELTCISNTFVYPSEPNNLYMTTYVETKAATPYYTEYMLKYTLTDDEMEDYDMLHEQKYIEAIFMNDAISQTKTPTIVSKTRCTVEAHNTLKQSLKNKSKVTSVLQLEDFILKDHNRDDNIFNVLIYEANHEVLKTTQKVAVIPLKGKTQPIATNSDNAFYKPCGQTQFDFHSSFDTTTAAQTVIIYNTQHMDLVKTRGLNDYSQS